MMNICRFFWNNLCIMNSLHNYRYRRSWLHNFFYFCDVFRNFYLYRVGHLYFFDDFIRHWYFYSNRNFNSFFFNDLVGYWYFHSDVFSIMNNLRRWWRRLDVNRLLLYLNLLLDLRLDNNLMLLMNRDLLYCLNRLKGSNWLKSSHWLHCCLYHRLGLNWILVLSIISWTSSKSNWLIVFSHVVGRRCGYSHCLLRPWFINNHSWIFC